MVTAREAKKILERMQKQNRERQREWRKTQRDEGKQRVTAFITGEAYARLEKIRQTGRQTGDILTDALMQYDPDAPAKPEPGRLPAPERQDTDTTPTQPGIATGPVDPERLALLGKIRGMEDGGMTRAQIAANLNDEGIPTPSGIGIWKKGTLNNLVKRAKEQGLW